MRHAQVNIDPNLPHDKWEISEEAVNQAKTAISEMGELTKTITTIVSSNELKAMQTAELLGNELNLPTQVDDRFRELSLNEFFTDFEAFRAIRMRQLADPNYRYKQAETPLEGLKRFEIGLSELASGTLIVSHGTILTTYFNSLQKRTIEEIQTSWDNIRFCAWGYVQDLQVKRILA